MKNNESNHGKLCCLKYIGKDRGGKYIRMCFDAIRQLRDSKYLIGSEAEKDFIYERNLMISLAYLLGTNLFPFFQKRQNISFRNASSQKI